MGAADTGRSVTEATRLNSPSASARTVSPSPTSPGTSVTGQPSVTVLVLRSQSNLSLPVNITFYLLLISRGTIYYRTDQGECRLHNIGRQQQDFIASHVVVYRRG